MQQKIDDKNMFYYCDECSQKIHDYIMILYWYTFVERSRQYQHYILNYEHAKILLGEMMKSWDILPINLGSKMRKKSTQWNHRRASFKWFLGHARRPLWMAMSVTGGGAGAGIRFWLVVWIWQVRFQQKLERRRHDPKNKPVTAYCIFWKIDLTSGGQR